MMNRLTSRLRAAALGAAAATFALAMAAGTASAHQLWIEPSPKGATVYFGEFSNNARERSPGSLDKLPGPVATRAGKTGKTSVQLTKTARGFTVVGRVRAGQSITALEPAFPSWAEKTGDKTVRTAWTPAARYVPGFRAVAPTLDLDIVPTGKRGQLSVVFRGKPLARAEVTITAASGWERTLYTDDAGLVTVTTPWKSLYVVSVHHTDDSPGTRKLASGVERYDRHMFVTSLSFVIRSGLRSPKHPNPARPSDH